MNDFFSRIGSSHHVATLAVPDRSRIAPFAIDGRTLRAWMRGADLKAPKWKTSAIRWPDKWDDKPVARYSVSAASVTRARARVEQAAASAKPRSNEPLIWRRSDLEAVDYGTTISMLMDGLLDETGIATTRRVYSAEGLAMLARWERGLFSQVKHDAGPFWTAKTGILEERTAPHWRYIDSQIIAAPTESDLNAAFSRMLHWSAVINSKIRRHCNASTPACRAYQAAAVIRDCYLYGLRISATEMISANIVIEAVSEHLRRPGRIDWWQRTVTLDLLEGASSYEASERFGRDPSSLRERFDSETLAIEVKFGRYCRELWEPPQKRAATCYYRIEGEAPKPWTAERQLSASERAELVLRYVELAHGPMFRPMASDAAIAGLRYAYKLIAGYIEAGGRILTGYAPADLPEDWTTDRRSDVRVLEEGFTGSRYRKIGLDPFDF